MGRATRLGDVDGASAAYDSAESCDAESPAPGWSGSPSECADSCSEDAADGWGDDWELNDDHGDAQVQLQWDLNPAELQRAISVASVASDDASVRLSAAGQQLERRAGALAASSTCDCAEIQGLNPVSPATRDDWEMELEAVEAIFEDHFSHCLPVCCALACPSVRVRIWPRCGSQVLYTDKWADVRIDLHPTYPSDPPDFTVVASEGLNGGESMVLAATLRSAAADEAAVDAGATIYDAVMAGQELLTQMSTFVAHKRLKRDEAKARAAEERAELKRKLAREERKQREVEERESVVVHRVSDAWVGSRVPEPQKIIEMLAPIGTALKWLVTPVVTPFLLNRFRSECLKLRSTPALSFHGTDFSNCGSIRKIGLIVPGQGDAKHLRMKNGAAYGQGVYSSPNLGTALSYARGSVFLCLVALGKSNPTPGNGVGCNSTVCGNIWVAYRAEQVLPVYEMRFTQAGGQPARVYHSTTTVVARPPTAVSQELFKFKPGRNLNEKQKKKVAW